MELTPGHRLFAEDWIDEADAELLGQNLDVYNRGFLGETAYSRIGLFVRDEAGEIRAGLDGHVYAKWLFVALLWVHADLRRRGVGRELLNRAEQEAVSRGCHSAWLDTFSFQAPEFYKKQGYVPFGAIQLPPGHSRIFLQKSLARG